MKSQEHFMNGSTGDNSQEVCVDMGNFGEEETISDCKLCATNDNSNPQQGSNSKVRTSQKKVERRLTSSNHRKQSTMRVPPNKKDSRKLFVGGLPKSVNDTEFRSFFQRFGELSDSVVIYDRDTRNSRGFGFVTFRDVAVAQTVLGGEGKTSNMIMIHDKECEVKVSVPKQSQNTSETNDNIDRNRPYAKTDDDKHKENFNVESEGGRRNYPSRLEGDAGCNGLYDGKYGSAGSFHDDFNYNQQPCFYPHGTFESTTPFMYQGEGQVLPLCPSSVSFQKYLSVQGQHGSDPNGVFHPMNSSPYQYPFGHNFDLSPNYFPVNVEGQYLYGPHFAQSYAMAHYPPMITPAPFPFVCPQQFNPPNCDSSGCADEQKDESRNKSNYMNSNHNIDERSFCEKRADDTTCKDT